MHATVQGLYLVRGNAQKQQLSMTSVVVADASANVKVSHEVLPSLETPLR